MKLAVSSFAWPAAADHDAALVLREDPRVQGVELVLPKTFQDPANTTSAQAVVVGSWWQEQGLPVISVQSLAYGRPDLQLFGNNTIRAEFLDHLIHMAEITAALGATRMVFGSPANRKRDAMGMDEALDIATGFFQQLGDALSGTGVVCCIEPNPPIYSGCDFINTPQEAIELVARVGDPRIRTQCDTGAMAYMRAQGSTFPSTLLSSIAASSAHMHISAPGLPPLHAGLLDQAEIAASLAPLLVDRWCSIEMMVPADEPHWPAIRTAVRAACDWYPIG